MTMAPRQQPEFPIQPNLGRGIGQFFYSQFFGTPAYPTNSFADQTVIVTGSNTGLGLEAARHFYRLGAAKLVLAVRTVSKGHAAKEDIAKSVPDRTDAGSSIEVWPLDQASTASTIAFAERVKAELPRVDVAVLNAGVNNPTFQLSEGYEQTTQVNVLNTFLMALLLLPRLNETKANFPSDSSTPHLTVVSSEAHRLTKFEEINAPDLYAKLNDETGYSQQARYQVSKLLEILLVRELVARLNLKSSSPFTSPPTGGGAKTAGPPPPPPVIINLVNPGLCKSTLGIARDDAKPPPLVVRIVRRVLDRTTEVGARTLVLAASAPAASHGELQSDGQNQDVEAWIYSDVGQRAQRKVWEQTVRILEGRRPGVLREVGL